MIQKKLEHNKRFVEERRAEAFATDKHPARRTAIVTCMDTRLMELLPAALGIKGGDVKMIKNAGGVVTEPFGETMRALLVAVYELGVEYIMIIAHTGCGVQGMRPEHMFELMMERGIPASTIEMVRRSGVDVDAWLTGFDDPVEAVRRSVALVSEHPLLPEGIHVSGYLFDTVTAELRPVACEAEEA